MEITAYSLLWRSLACDTWNEAGETIDPEREVHGEFARTNESLALF